MNELETLKGNLIAVEAKMNKITGTNDSHLEEVRKHFHLGMVGGSGNRRNLSRLNARRERSIDKTIEQAGIYTKLYKEKEMLVKQIEYIESGRKERTESIKQIMAEQVKNAKLGDTVVDSAFGEAIVIKVNKKTLTIQTPSGYKEARPFNLIVGVKKAI